jgi:hypothetical protein
MPVCTCRRRSQQGSRYPAGFQVGLGASVSLQGLNGSNPNVPFGLQAFSPVLFWQGQANTTLSYNTDGSLNTSCSGVCTHIFRMPGSQQMLIGAS